eukprot:5272563-Amphidinium_carterae.1
MYRADITLASSSGPNVSLIGRHGTSYTKLRMEGPGGYVLPLTPKIERIMAMFEYRSVNSLTGAKREHVV